MIVSPMRGAIDLMESIEKHMMAAYSKDLRKEEAFMLANIFETIIDGIVQIIIAIFAVIVWLLIFVAMLMGL